MAHSSPLLPENVRSVSWDRNKPGMCHSITGLLLNSARFDSLWLMSASTQTRADRVYFQRLAVNNNIVTEQRCYYLLLQDFRIKSLHYDAAIPFTHRTPPHAFSFYARRSLKTLRVKVPFMLFPPKSIAAVTQLYRMYESSVLPKRGNANSASRISTYYGDTLTERQLCFSRRSQEAKRSRSLSCREASPDVAGCRSCSLVGMWMEKRGGGGRGGGRYRVERRGLSLVRALLRWNKPRLRNDIFSHPSNKLYIQQIAGPSPNHFFPLQLLKSCI